LECDSHSVQTVFTASEALQKFDATFDLVFLDMDTPSTSANPLATELRERSPDVGIIMLSGLTCAGTPPSVDFVVQKPFSVPAIRSAIAQLR
jgi:DNA-binding response OmpR family regulator